jgi:hypothetical protein
MVMQIFAAGFRVEGRPFGAGPSAPPPAPEERGSSRAPGRGWREWLRAVAWRAVAWSRTPD